MRPFFTTLRSGSNAASSNNILVVIFTCLKKKKTYLSLRSILFCDSNGQLNLGFLLGCIYTSFTEMNNPTSEHLLLLVCLPTCNVNKGEARKVHGCSLSTLIPLIKVHIAKDNRAVLTWKISTKRDFYM